MTGGSVPAAPAHPAGRRAPALAAWLWPAAASLIALALAELPGNQFSAAVAALASVQALYVVGWAFLAGEAGQVSFGHALPYGGGAYVTALLAGSAGLPPVLAAAAGAAAGAALGLGQGTAVRRAGPLVLAAITLASAEAAHEVVGNLSLPSSGGSFPGESAVTAAVFMRDERAAAGLAALALAAGLLALTGVARSRLGLALRAVHADPRAAAAAGVAAAAARITAFAISGGIAGLSGALVVGLLGHASAEMLSIQPSLFAAAAAVAGRLDTLVGPAAVAYGASIAIQWLEPAGSIRLIAYAAVLAAAAFVRPRRA